MGIPVAELFLPPFIFNFIDLWEGEAETLFLFFSIIGGVGRVVLFGQGVLGGGFKKFLYCVVTYRGSGEYGEKGEVA